MAYTQGYESNMPGIDVGSNGAITIVPDPTIPMYRPRLALGDPSDKSYWTQVWTTMGQPYTTTINANSMNQEFYFTLATDNPNVFVNWQDSWMSLGMQCQRNSFTSETAAVLGITTGPLNITCNANWPFISNALNKVFVLNFYNTPAWLWYHGTHTFFNKIELKHITSGKVIERMQDSDIWTQASLYALPSASKRIYLEKYGATLTDFTWPALYLSNAGAGTTGPAVRTGAMINPFYQRYPGAMPVAGTMGTTSNYVPYSYTSAGIVDPHAYILDGIATAYTDANLVAAASANFGLPIDLESRTSDSLGFQVTGAPAAITTSALSASQVYTVGFDYDNCLIPERHRLDDYYTQLKDLFRMGTMDTGAGGSQAPGFGPAILNGGVTTDPIFVYKHVMIPSSYLNNGQKLYLKAEPLELRFTMNNINRVLTAIHPTGSNAVTGLVNASIAKSSGFPLEGSAGYAIALKDIALNLKFEEMPPEIINKLNAKWTDPNVGLIKDFTRVTANVLPNLTSSMGTRIVMQVIANDIHHLKKVLIICRPFNNEGAITADRYQFSDGSVWGDQDASINTATGQSRFTSLQFQIGVDFFPQLPIDFTYSRENLRYYTNEVMFNGNSAFIDNMLDEKSYMGRLNKPVTASVHASASSQVLPSDIGGLASKFMIGYDFSRHAHSLRAGVSLEQRPLQIILTLNRPLKEDLIPEIFLIHEATFTITPTTATLLV